MAHTFKGGIHPDDKKSATSGKAIELLPAPAQVVLPMSMHIGRPCEPIVKVGDHVYLGQKIADAQAPVCAPIHASVSGTVVAVEPRPYSFGTSIMSVVIENDFKDTIHESVKPNKSLEELTPAEIIDIVKNAGIVGMGGAGFPTYVKLNPGKPIDAVLVNACECEPYITSDTRMMVDHTDLVVKGVHLLHKWMNAKKVVICIEDNKPDAVALLQNKVADMAGIEVCVAKTKYPQGAEKMIIQSATGRKMPPGKLPSDVGCIVMNITSVATLFRYITTGIPLTTKRITVDGNAVGEPKNLIVPIGTPISYILENCNVDNPEKVLLGGPMMGTALVNTDVPIIKSYNAVLAFSKGTIPEKPDNNCIRCGRCSQVCPMGLMPTNIMRSVKARDFDGLKQSNVIACMQCGTCAYACPAGRPLVQYVVLAKDMLREEGAKNG